VEAGSSNVIQMNFTLQRIKRTELKKTDAKTLRILYRMQLTERSPLLSKNRYFRKIIYFKYKLLLVHGSKPFVRKLTLHVWAPEGTYRYYPEDTAYAVLFC
jgi:hypothetical protein